MTAETGLIAVFRGTAESWWRNWLHLTVFNLVWVLSWVFIILGPPMTLTAYAYLRRLDQGDEMTVREILATVRTHLLQGWLWLLPSLGIVPLTGLSAGFYGSLDAPWAPAILALIVFVTGVWLLLQFYVLPYLFVQDRRSLRLAYKNAALTLLASPLYSLGIALVCSLLLTVSLRFVALIFLCSPVLVAILGTHAVNDRLRRFQVYERSQS